MNFNVWRWHPQAPTLDNYIMEVYDINLNKIEFFIEINKNCVIFNDKLIFVDQKGSVSTMMVSLDKIKTLNKNQDGHTYKKQYNKDYYLNTQNNYSESMEVNTDWLDIDEYNYTMDLFKSPYVWYEEDGMTPRPCTIQDSSITVQSDFHYRFQRKFNIKLI